MKRITFLLLSTILISLTSRGKVWFPNFVECYYSGKTANSLLIYDGFKGGVIETLPTLRKGLWYKIAISESKEGWFKVEDIQIVPGLTKGVIIKNNNGFKDKWIKTDFLRINIADMYLEPKDGIWFFEKPNIESKPIYKSGEFLVTRLIEVSNTWARVKFNADGKRYVGWLKKEDQCPAPWTSCPKTTSYNK